MTAPKTTIWPLEPHTRAKHEILRRYLQAWTPILSQGGFPEFVYVDGFAGPGRYSGGEIGSPIIALSAALEHRVPIKARVRYLFVEKDLDRGASLASVVSDLALPPNFDVTIRPGVTFEVAYDDFRVANGRQRSQRPPTFAFIDPFGWTGIPFRIVEDILKAASGEVLVTFMFEEVNRFLANPEQAGNFDDLFGTAEWRRCLQAADPKARSRCIHDVYLQQLRQKAKYVRSFEMRNDRDVTDYFLFFATNNQLGIKKMKEAMWKADETGEFRFSDATDPNQSVLFTAAPNYSALRLALRARFSGAEATVGEVENFVLAETSFRETHYKPTLKDLETSEPSCLAVVDAKPGRRRGTFADPSMRVRFGRC